MHCHGHYNCVICRMSTAPPQGVRQFVNLHLLIGNICGITLC